MKKIIYFLFLVSNQLFAQNEGLDLEILQKQIKKFKEDSTQNAIKLALTTQSLQQLKLEKDKLTTLTKLFSDSTIKPVNSSITISNNGVAMAETKALMMLSLKKYFNDSIKLDECLNISKEDDRGKKNIILNFSDYPLIPQYYIVTNRLKKLKAEFDKKNSVSGGSFSAGATLATVIGVARAASELLTILKTDSEFKINDESVSEEDIAGLLVGSSNIKGYKIYTPDIIPIGVGTFGENSILLTSIEETEKSESEATKQVDKELDAAKKDLTKKMESLAKKEEELKKLEDSLKKAPTNSTIQANIAAAKKEIDETLKPQTDKAEQTLEGKQNNKNSLTNLSKELSETKKYLNQAVKDDSLTSAGSKLLIVEKLITKLKDTNTYTLRIRVKGKGTNKMTKHFLGINLKHSASVDFNYLLYNSDGELICGKTGNSYTPLTKSKDIPK